MKIPGRLNVGCPGGFRRGGLPLRCDAQGGEPLGTVKRQVSGIAMLRVSDVCPVLVFPGFDAIRAIRGVGGFVPAVHARASSSVAETDEGRDSARATLNSAAARLWSSRVTDPCT